MIMATTNSTATSSQSSQITNKITIENASNEAINNNTINNNTNNNNNNNSLNSSNLSNSSSSQLNEQQPGSTTSQTTSNLNTTSSANDENATTNATTNCSSPNLASPENRWIFPLEKIENSPSRLDGLTADQELSERQEAALFISDLGSVLRVNQLCVNTAIIYMHRFFMIHSFKKFHRYVRMVATSCLFLACKVEEQPRRLREFIEAIQNIFHKSNEHVTRTPEEYRKYGEEITALEACLLQTLGFNVLINHAQTFIIKTCQMIKAPRDLAEAAYLTATNSLILTNFCVKFSPEKIACFCIYLACKWTSLIIPTSSEGRQWYQYVKHDIVEQELEDISKEYLAIYDKSPIFQKKLGKNKVGEDNINQPSNIRTQHTQQPRNPQHPYQNIKKQNPHHQEMHPSNYQTQQNNVNMPKQTNQQAQPHKNQIQNGGQHHQNYPYGQQQKLQNQSHQISQHRSQQQQLKNISSAQLTVKQPVPPQQHPQHPQQQVKHLSNSNLNVNKSNGNSNLNGSTNIKNTDANIDKSLYNINKKPIVTNLNGSNTSIKISPSSTPSSSATASTTTTTSSTTTTTTTTSMKRGNEELNTINSAPNKIPKYIVDQKSAS